MPIPKPNQSEKREEYISRCMSQIKDEYDAEGQAIAICISTYEKEDMNKITDTMSKVMARVAYDTKYKGINLKEAGDPCWEGYEMIGMKDDGTPNCVPIKKD